MFDLVTGKAVHIPHTPGVSIVVSMAAQVTVIGLLMLVPALYVTDQLPKVSTMMAFVAPAPPPPAPPPPPPAPVRTLAARPAPTTGATAPVNGPSQLALEVATSGSEEGIPGGVEGGVLTGVVGGVVGGFEIEAPPPPPAPRVPVRVGGQILPPALVHRVEPVYPAVAVAAHVEGTIILEAVVDEEGRVENIRVLRSIKLLDNAAMEAVRQWRYRPLLLNDRPSPFVLTVVLTFSLEQR